MWFQRLAGIQDFDDNKLVDAFNDSSQEMSSSSWPRRKTSALIIQPGDFQRVRLLRKRVPEPFSRMGVRRYYPNLLAKDNFSYFTPEYLDQENNSAAKGNIIPNFEDIRPPTGTLSYSEQDRLRLKRMYEQRQDTPPSFSHDPRAAERNLYGDSKGETEGPIGSSTETSTFIETKPTPVDGTSSHNEFRRWYPESVEPALRFELEQRDRRHRNNQQASEQESDENRRGIGELHGTGNLAGHSMNQDFVRAAILTGNFDQAAAAADFAVEVADESSTYRHSDRRSTGYATTMDNADMNRLAREREAGGARRVRMDSILPTQHFPNISTTRIHSDEPLIQQVTSVPDRWAEIKKKASERAAMRQSDGGYISTTDGDNEETSDEECK